MTATDRLRELLDERGVEWEALSDQQEGDFTITATRWHDSEGGLLTMFISEPHGSTWDFFWLPTPEQAIAATLGAVEYRKPTTLSQLEAENAKLREELELWHRLTAGIELPEYPMTQFQPREHFEPKEAGE